MKTFLYVIGLLCLLTAAGCTQTVNVTFTWNAPGDDDTVGTCTHYSIRYNTSQITETNWLGSSIITQSQDMSPKPYNQPETLSVSLNLSYGTYYFRMKSADEVLNWSELSNQVSLVVSDQTPPSVILNFNAVRQ